MRGTGEGHYDWDLRPNSKKVFVNSQKQPDGSLAAARVNVGLKGQVPPM
jgi:hypothetical protein